MVAVDVRHCTIDNHHVLNYDGHIITIYEPRNQQLLSNIYYIGLCGYQRIKASRVHMPSFTLYSRPVILTLRTAASFLFRHNDSILPVVSSLGNLGSMNISLPVWTELARPALFKQVKTVSINIRSLPVTCQPGASFKKNCYHLPGTPIIPTTNGSCSSL